MERISMEENKFKGERLVAKSQVSKNVLIEHLARYRLVKGSKESIVLDIGCGTGAGSNILAKNFKRVYGVDISSDSIEYCKKNWKRKNISFLVGSGTDIPFPANTFDILAAFEVFEHIKDWKKFLSELKRVTKIHGKIYISTPNKDVYSPGTKKSINPYHFFEMTEKQFKKALSKDFKIDSFLGQRTPIYNDHWIWKIVDPFLFTFHGILPFKFHKALKFKIVNWIKPELSLKDIIFSDQQDWVKKSRQIVAICINNK